MTAGAPLSGGGEAGGLDRIALRGLRARGYHGVLAAERELGQEFSADVVLHLDTRPAAASDDLSATVNYASVATDVVNLLAGEPVDLLETLAQHIATAALAYPGVRRVDVTLHKPQAPITVPFDDVTLTISRGAEAPTPPGDDTAAEAVLALGGNLGDVRANLRAAVHALGRHPRIELLGVSPLARTPALLAPGQAPQPDYRNAVARVRTGLDPRELLAACQGIESALGRVRAQRWGQRTVDIDVIAIGDLRQADDVLTVPHPRAHERDFVLAPWVRLQPAAELPGHGPIAGLLARLPAQLSWEGDWDGEDWQATASRDDRP
ncbi:MAG TPA: 2-amino-4-hydroxy-6-hydroxymethyldihydropteridine diphosphokinase [Actinomycetaceae bacterium]|nr:2-amino-4-hydroxy-6-hydroxymethyldihydropteridine diphosphokinase [Actinomycetaceae bacterium]